MRNLKHLAVVCLLLFSTFAAGSVGATSTLPTYNSGSFGCNVVRFSYTGNGTVVNFRVVDGSDQVVSNTAVSKTNGTHTMTLKLNPRQQPGTLLQIQQNYGGWSNFGPATTCAGTADDGPPPAPWEQFGGENAYAAFRFVEDGPDNPVLVFLRVSNDGEGSILFYISKKMLERDYPCTGKLVEIYSSVDDLYHLRRLPTCEIQANVGPDFEGKTHVVGFSSIPPGDDVYDYTYFPGGPIMRWFGDDLMVS